MDIPSIVLSGVAGGLIGGVTGFLLYNWRLSDEVRSVSRRVSALEAKSPGSSIKLTGNKFIDGLITKKINQIVDGIDLTQLLKGKAKQGAEEEGWLEG